MVKEIRIILLEILIKRDISFLVFMVSLFLLPFSINLSTFTLIFSIVLKLIQTLIKRTKLFTTIGLRNAAIIGLVFFVFIVVNSIAQTDVNTTFLNFEKQYMHFTLFLLTPLLLRGKSENKLLVSSFFLGTFLAVLYVFTFALINKITFDKYAFLNVLDIHHTYLSMYLLAFVNYAMVQIMVRKKGISIHMKIIISILILIYFGVIFILDSKASMIIFLFLFIVHSLPELSKKKAPIHLIILSVILYILFVFNNKVSVNYERALDFRLQIWDVSFKVFEDNPFFGNLTLPEKDILNYNHYLNGKYYFLDSDLNSHNEYLSILMRFGLAGVLILLFFIINIFIKITSKTSKQTIREFLGFLIIILIVCYIENILDRHHGIVCLAFFYNYYLVAIENAKA